MSFARAMAQMRTMPVLSADWRSEMATAGVVVVVTQLFPLGHYTEAPGTWFHTRYKSVYFAEFAPLFVGKDTKSF